MEQKKINTISKIVAGSVIAAAILIHPTETSKEYYKQDNVIVQQQQIQACETYSEKLNLLRKAFPDKIEESLHDNKWDTKELITLQRNYIKTRSVACEDDVIENGVAKDVILLMPLVEEISKRYNVDPAIIGGIIQSESFGYQGALNDGNPHKVFIRRYRKWETVGRRELSVGLMQINVLAHKLQKTEYENIFEPKTNIETGTALFANLLSRYHGNVEMALMAYNKGPRKVSYKSALRDKYARNVLEHADAIRAEIDSLTQKPETSKLIRK